MRTTYSYRAVSSLRPLVDDQIEADIDAALLREFGEGAVCVRMRDANKDFKFWLEVPITAINVEERIDKAVGHLLPKVK